METKISIIMPCYNAENIIEDSLDTILNQTFCEFEIICIDDCSEDKTLNILDELANFDKRITVIHNKKRLGAANCRNYGLEKAKGRYVIFLDCDDFFDKQMLELSYGLSEEENLDICMFDYLYQEYFGKERKPNRIFQSRLTDSKYSKKVFNCKDIEYRDIDLFITAAWNKLYKRSFIIENKLKFQNLTSSNDVLFSFTSYMVANRIRALSADPLVIQNEHNLTKRITDSRKAKNEYYASIALCQNAKDRHFDKVQWELIAIKTTLMIIAQFNCKEGDKEYYSFLGKEGIRSLLNIGGKDLYEALVRFNNPLNKFVTDSMNSLWFEHFSVVDLVLWDNRNMIWELWDKYNNISIWGAGRYGEKLIRAIMINKKKINHLYDTNENKIGEELLGIKIEKPIKSNIKDSDVVIISLKNVPYDIIDEIGEIGTKVEKISDYISNYNIGGQEKK